MDLELLASYVPPPVMRQLANCTLPISTHIAETWEAAVLFADISGSTQLAERAVRRGPAGIEELSRYFNLYFGQLVELIGAHGGEVIKFAGDALIAQWMPHGESLSMAAFRAAGCALAMQESFGRFRVTEDTVLSTRIGLSVGEVSGMCLGGIRNRWEFVFSGAPLIQVGQAEKRARPGQVVASPDFWELTQEMVSGHTLDDGFTRIERLLSSSPAPPSLVRELKEGNAEQLRLFIPGAIRERLDAGHAGWLAELRLVTVVFINLPDLHEGVSPERAQQMMRTLQEVLYQFEGSLNKVSVDDKGISLVVVFGLPPVVHEDDPVRAVKFTLLLQTELASIRARYAIGVATGRCFCGSIGNKLRREYTVIGDVANLAARLMEDAPGAVLCDQVTYEATQQPIAFEYHAPLNVKGKGRAIDAYVPVRSKSRLASAKITSFVGRIRERDALNMQLERLAEGNSGLVIIEGEAGIGKSRILTYLQEVAREFAVYAMVGWGDAIEQNRPYHAVAPIFTSLFDLGAVTDTSSARQQVKTRLVNNAAFMDLLPLLNAVLPLDLPETDATAKLHGEGRASKTKDFLVQMLIEFTPGKPLLLIIEDSHWMDSASWALLRLIALNVQPLLLVLATRPIMPESRKEYAEFLLRPDLVHLNLDDLGRTEIEMLIRNTLGISSLPQTVADFIHERAGGNPFFSEELAYALRDAGLLRVEDGRTEWASTNLDVQRLAFPATVEGVISSRFDRLSPAEQLTLKVASVIGRLFSVRILRDVHPIEVHEVSLQTQLAKLESLGIVLQESLSTEPSYLFKHSIIQDVIYNLMIFQQRQKLHSDVADWIEENHGHELSSYYSILAHHLRQGGRPRSAVEYMEKAGEQALQTDANQEALEFFLEATDLNRSHALRFDTFREVGWHRRIGEASFNLGNLKESRHHLEKTLALSGRPVPSSRISLIGRSLMEVVRQGVHRVLPTQVARKSNDERALLLEMARAHNWLGRLHYFNNSPLEMVHCCVEGLNRAEAAGPSPQLAEFYANFSIVLGFVPLHSLAKYYGHRALETAYQVNDSATLVNVLFVTSVYNITIGEWLNAKNALEEAASVAEKVGIQRRLEELWSFSAEVERHIGNLPRALEFGNANYLSAKRRGDRQFELVGLGTRAEALWRLGQIRDCVSALEDAKALLMADVQHSDQIWIYGMLARAYWHMGDHLQAVQTADRVVEWLNDFSPAAHYPVEGCVGVADVYLSHWETQDGVDNMPNEDTVRRAHVACKSLHQFARTYRITRPAAWLWQGLFHWLRGEGRRAEQAWHKSLSYATKLKMPYDEALARYELGRHLSGQRRAEQLAQAATTFERLQASYGQSRTHEELEIGSR